jgi:hypothetical protein
MIAVYPHTQSKTERSLTFLRGCEVSLSDVVRMDSSVRLIEIVVAEALRESTAMARDDTGQAG